MLPPREGYVERDNEYVPTPGTQRIIGLEKRTVENGIVSSIVFVQLAQTEQFDEVTILEHKNHFIEWTEHYTGKRGQIVRDGDELYKALHDIGDGQSHFKPSDSPTLWKMVGNPANEWPVWSQPISGVDSFYRIGDKVSHKDTHWVCSQENTPVGNSYEPGVWGWTVAVE